MNTTVLVIISLVWGTTLVALGSLVVNLREVIRYLRYRRVDKILDRRFAEDQKALYAAQEKKPGYAFRAARRLEDLINRRGWGERVFGHPLFAGLERKLVLAGNPDGYGALEYVLSSLFLWMIMVTAGYILLVLIARWPLWGWVIYCLLPTLYPIMHLRAKIEERTNRILTEFPRMVDFLRLCICTTSTLDTALRAYVKYRRGVLATEIAQTLLDIRTGRKPEQNAWEDFAHRCGLAETDELASAILQHKLGGVPLADTLAHLGMVAEKSYQEKVEEKINQATVQLVVPAALLIVSLLVILLVPAFQIFFQMF